MRRIRYGRWGLAEDPRWLKVRLVHEGQVLLGDVREVFPFDDGAGTRMLLRVTHFNGDRWPITPIASAVEVIE